MTKSIFKNYFIFKYFQSILDQGTKKNFHKILSSKLNLVKNVKSFQSAAMKQKNVFHESNAFFI